MTPTDPFGLVGQVLDGQFRVEKLVGEGGFSAVYRGHHLGLDEPVAIKCLKLPPALGAQLVDSFVQRFRDESRILYRLSQGNLHIVRSIGAGATKATTHGLVVPYMVLEWLEGRSMANDFTVRKTLGKSGRTLDEVLTLFASAADALGFAHAQGVVHRDLNPGNLFLAKTPAGPFAEKMKVLDFGVAKILDDTTMNLGPRAQTMGQIRIFAPAYGSPEQFDDALGAVASPSDVYSFSLVLLEALRDKPVNDGSNLGEFAHAAIDANKRPTPRSLGLNVPDAVEQVFVKATKLKPAERFQNVGEMWKAFEAAVKTKSPSSRPVAPRAGASTQQGIGDPTRGPMSRTLPLNSPNLAMPRPAIGLPSKVGASGAGASPSTATSKLKPATSPSSSPAPNASPLSTSLPGVGNAKATPPAAGPPPTQRFAGAGSGPLPAPPPRAALGNPRPVASPLAAPPPKIQAAGQSAQKQAPATRPPSEPPLHEDEELPTRVGQSPLMDALPSESPTDPPKALPNLGRSEGEEEDVTRVREPGDDLLAAAVAAAVTGANTNAPNAGAGRSGKPERPSSIPPAPDSGHTLMMPAGGGGIPMPPPQQPFAPSPSASIDAAPMTPHGHAPLHGQGGLGSTVALGSGSGINDFRPTPYQPLQAPPQYPAQPGQPMQSTPFAGAGDWQQQQGQHSPSMPHGTPPMAVPAHFAHAHAPAQFQQGAYPTGAHPQPGFADASAQPAQSAKGLPTGFIIAAVAFLVIGLGGIGVFLLMGRSGSSPATEPSATAAPTPVPVPVPSPTPSPVVTTPPVVDPSAPGAAPPVADDTAAPTPTTTAAPTNAAPTNTAPTNTAAATSTAPTPINPIPTPVTPTPGTATATPTATAKPVPSAAPAADPNAWNESAARARLSQANGVLVFCKKPDEPTGPGSASITFSPEGAVSNVTLDPPYAGTKAGDCVVGQFKRAKVNAFQGSSQTIKHTFEVPK